MNGKDIVILWEASKAFFDSELQDDLVCSFSELVVQLRCSYMDQQEILLTFDSTFCFRYTTQSFSSSEFFPGMFNTLVEIKNSAWIKNLEENDPIRFKAWSLDYLKHYAIFFDRVGLYQFIARKYSISVI